LTKLLERVPKEILEGWKAELSRWTEPKRYRARTDEICLSIDRKTFFSQGGLAFLRDAWVADALASDAVRLVPAEKPDFEIHRGGAVEQFEITEADMDGRRRGDEPDVPHLQPDPVEKWRKRFEAIAPALDRVVTKKLAKEYAPGVALVVYVNLGCYGAYLDEGIPILRRGTSLAKEKFKSVFAMWEGTLYKFWEDGLPAADQWQFATLDDF
jgi:hypothetical protein